MSDHDDPTFRDLLDDDGEPIPASSGRSNGSGHCRKPFARRCGNRDSQEIQAVGPSPLPARPGSWLRTIFGDGTTLIDLIVKQYLHAATHPKHPDRQAFIDLINRLDGKPMMTVQVNEGPSYRIYDSTDEDGAGIKGYASNAESRLALTSLMPSPA